MPPFFPRVSFLEERRMPIKDWIVVAGSIVDTTDGGGFEFFGPYTLEEAEETKARILIDKDPSCSFVDTCICVQLISA